MFIYPKIHKPESAYTRNFHILGGGTQNLVLATVKLNTESKIVFKICNRKLIEVPLATFFCIGLLRASVHGSSRCPGLHISQCLGRLLHSFRFQVDVSIVLGIRFNRDMVFGDQVHLFIVFNV